MSGYLDLTQFRDLTIASQAIVDRVEAQHPGWILRQATFHSDRFDSRLRKRYAVPFTAPVPPTVQGWLCAVMTPLVLLKAGMAAEDEIFAAAERLANTAEEQLKEAADAEKGLFDLPLRADTAASGIVHGAPLSYSEASPYVWRDHQRETGREEDANR